MDDVVPADHRVKMKESKKRNKYLDLTRELKKKTIEHERDGDTSCIELQKGLVQGLEDLEIRRRVVSIVEIDQNTEKSPGDLRSLAVTQTSVSNHQLTLVWKTLKRVSSNNDNNNIKKKIRKIVDFADHRIKLKECEKRDKYLNVARKLKKTEEHECDNNTNCDWCFWHGN